MYFIFMMYTNIGEDKIIPKDPVFFGTVNQSWSRIMPCFLSVVPKFSEIREAYYEKNTKERLITQVKKIRS